MRAGRLEPPPPFETKLFLFHVEFSEKSGKNTDNQVQLNKPNYFVNLNPLSRNPGRLTDF